jgi:hypothetical protein
LVLAGICLLAIVPFFWKGNPSGHDFEFHMYSWMDVLSQWKHGVAYPRWAELAHWGYGEPRFLFYPPASWTLGAALGATLPWKVVPGAYCLIVLTLAAASMYRLALVWLPPKDAMFAALFYALNPYHLLIVYWRSAYAELLGAVLLPLALLFLLRINDSAWEPPNSSEPNSSAQDGIDRPNALARSTIYLSLTLAAAWLTNLPAAVMIHYSMAGLALLFAVRAGGPDRSSIKRSSTKRPEWRSLLATAGAVVMGVALASFYLLPAIYEQRWINIDQVLSPGVRPQDNFLFTVLADADHNRFNLLVSFVAIAEIIVLVFAIVVSHRHQTRRAETALAGPVDDSTATASANPWMLLSAWGAASALIMFSFTNLLWQHLPKFRFVQLPFRWLLCMNVALAVLLAMAARRWISRLATFAALLATLIVVGHLTQPPWWDTAADIREMADFIADGSGYEGTDEYVPAGADASELNKNLPRISDDSGHAVRSKVMAWGPTEKHFTVLADGVQNIVVRIFSYPAWKAVVNGVPVATEKTETTGLMVIPVPDGEADVHIYLRRTTDQVVGDIISLVSLGLLIIIWMKPASINLSRVFFRTQRLDKRPDKDPDMWRDMRPNTTASPAP